MTGATATPIGAAVFSGPDELALKVSQARKGERIVYHRGFLARDRMMAHGENHEAPRIGRVADAVKKLFEAGMVMLTQHKLREGVYEYYATKR